MSLNGSTSVNLRKWWCHTNNGLVWLVVNDIAAIEMWELVWWNFVVFILCNEISVQNRIKKNRTENFGSVCFALTFNWFHFGSVQLSTVWFGLTFFLKKIELNQIMLRPNNNHRSCKGMHAYWGIIGWHALRANTPEKTRLCKGPNMSSLRAKNKPRNKPPSCLMGCPINLFVMFVLLISSLCWCRPLVTWMSVSVSEIVASGIVKCSLGLEF